MVNCDDSLLNKSFSLHFERQKGPDKFGNEIEKEVLPIQVIVLYVIYIDCLKVAVVILIQDNIKLSFCEDSW